MYKSLKEFLEDNFDNKDVINGHNKFVKTIIGEWELNKFRNYDNVRKVEQLNPNTIKGRQDIVRLYYMGNTEEEIEMLVDKLSKNTILVKSFKVSILERYLRVAKQQDKFWDYWINMYKSVLIDDSVLKKYVEGEKQYCEQMLISSINKLQRLHTTR